MVILVDLLRSYPIRSPLALCAAAARGNGGSGSDSSCCCAASRGNDDDGVGANAAGDAVIASATASADFPTDTVADGVEGDEEGEEDVDEDVVAEALRVRDGGADGDAIRLVNLRKVYGCSIFDSCGSGSSRTSPPCSRCCCRSKGRLQSCMSRRCWSCCYTRLWRLLQGRGRKVAVRDLSFGVPKGQVFGFLGINGAGKTTTLTILTGGMRATSGDGYLNGQSVMSQLQATRAQLG